MKRIFIVRHGQDYDNAMSVLNGRRNEPMTKEGHEQVFKKAKEFAQVNQIDAIISSPLIRAFKTATIFQTILTCPVPPRVWPELIERDFGILTGKFKSEIPKFSKKTFQSDQKDQTGQSEKTLYFLEAEGAETFQHVYDRALKVLDRIEREFDNKRILVVTHGDMAKMIRAAFFGWSWEEGLRQPNLGNAQILELVPISKVIPVS